MILLPVHHQLCVYTYCIYYHWEKSVICVFPNKIRKSLHNILMECGDAMDNTFLWEADPRKSYGESLLVYQFLEG